MSKYTRVKLDNIINESGMVEVEGIPKGLASHRRKFLDSLIRSGPIFWTAIIGDGKLLAKRSRWRSLQNDTHYSALLYASQTGVPVVFQGKLSKDLQGNPLLDVQAYKVKEIKTYGFEE